MPEKARETSVTPPGQKLVGLGDDGRTVQALRIARAAVASEEEVLAYAFTVIGPSLLVCGWGGPLTVTAFRDQKHLVLTSRHLVIISAARKSTKPTAVFATIPRTAITDARPKAGILRSVLRIDVAGHILRIEFSREQGVAYQTMVQELTRSAQDAEIRA